MRVLGASDLDSRDCVVPGCVREAETGRMHCAEHRIALARPAAPPPDPDDDLSDLDLENAKRVLGLSSQAARGRG